MMVLDNAKAEAEAETEFDNKSCFAMWVDSKTIFEPYQDSQNKLFGHQKVQK